MGLAATCAEGFRSFPAGVLAAWALAVGFTPAGVLAETVRITRPVTSDALHERTTNIHVAVDLGDPAGIRSYRVTLEQELPEQEGGPPAWKTIHPTRCDEAGRSGAQLTDCTEIEPVGRDFTTVDPARDFDIPVVLRQAYTRVRAVLTRTDLQQPQRFASNEVKLAAAPPPQTFAIVIGIDGYAARKNPETDPRPLCYPSVDASAISKYLSDIDLKSYKGDEPFLRALSGRRVIAMIPSASADKATIMGTLSAVAKLSTYVDTVLVFFSGHGIRAASDAHEFFMIPQGGVFSEYDADAVVHDVSLQEIAHVFSETIRFGRVQRIVVVLDACYSGNATWDPHVAPSEYVLFASTRQDQEALDRRPGEECEKDGKGKNGFFVTTLLEALRGKMVPSAGDPNP